MKKLIVCQAATILCGLLAIVSYCRTDELVGDEHNHKLIREAFGLLSGLFATQWVEYQTRFRKNSAQKPMP